MIEAVEDGPRPNPDLLQRLREAGFDEAFIEEYEADFARAREVGRRYAEHVRAENERSDA